MRNNSRSYGGVRLEMSASLPFCFVLFFCFVVVVFFLGGGWGGNFTLTKFP